MYSFIKLLPPLSTFFFLRIRFEQLHNGSLWCHDVVSRFEGSLQNNLSSYLLFLLCIELRSALADDDDDNDVPLFIVQTCHRKWIETSPGHLLWCKAIASRHDQSCCLDVLLKLSSCLGSIIISRTNSHRIDVQDVRYHETAAAWDSSSILWN